MVAVKGIYQGGDIVKLETASIPVNEPYEVVVAFLNPVPQPENQDESIIEKHPHRKKTFDHFMQYRGTLPADFDYSKELADYRDERYGHTN